MNEDKTHRNPVMSHRLRSRHKTYFFDVYENKHGNHYLKLTQSIRDINSTTDNPQYFRETLHIYEDSIYEFHQHFKDVIQLIEEKNKSNPSKKSESVDENSTSKKEDEQE
ncbi:MAG: DUF3276 family protein [Flavobacteriaceae bacterium]|nr:DUF3276 family protein [Flavobacteriaceae bacterium]